MTTTKQLKFVYVLEIRAMISICFANTAFSQGLRPTQTYRGSKIITHKPNIHIKFWKSTIHHHSPSSSINIDHNKSKNIMQC